MEEQVQQAILQLQNQMQTLQQQLTAEQNRNQVFERVAGALEQWTQKQSQPVQAQLVDTRGVGKPSCFGAGTEKELE